MYYVLKIKEREREDGLLQWIGYTYRFRSMSDETALDYARKFISEGYRRFESLAQIGQMDDESITIFPGESHTVNTIRYIDLPLDIVEERVDSVLGLCPHGIDLDYEFCSKGCRV